MTAHGSIWWWKACWDSDEKLWRESNLILSCSHCSFGNGPWHLVPEVLSQRALAVPNHQCVRDQAGWMSAGQGSSWCSGLVLLTIKVPAIEPEGCRAERWTEMDVDEKLSNGFHWCPLSEWKFGSEVKFGNHKYIYMGVSFYLFSPSEAHMPNSLQFDIIANCLIIF